MSRVGRGGEGAQGSETGEGSGTERRTARIEALDEGVLYWVKRSQVARRTSSRGVAAWKAGDSGALGTAQLSSKTVICTHACTGNQAAQRTEKCLFSHSSCSPLARSPARRDVTRAA